MNSFKGKEKEKEKELNNKSPKNYNYNVSDIIVKNIIEKILSLTITTADKHQIEKEIPDYCFDGIKESLELAMCIDFLNYDKDDMKHKNTLLNSKSKSMEKIKNINNKSFYDLKKVDKSFRKKVRIKNKSEKLKKYKLCKSLDPNISNEISINLDVFKPSVKKKDKNINKRQDKDKDKEERQSEINLNPLLLNKLIIRDINDNQDNKNKFEKKNETFKKENDDPFIINVPEIENTHEPHKIFESNLRFHTSMEKVFNKEKIILYDIIKEGKNHWGTIMQPEAPSIDREAGTKIKYTKPILKLKKNKDFVKEEFRIREVEEHSTIRNPTLNEKKEKTNKKNNENKKKLIKTNQNLKEPEKNVKKKKYMPIIEFPSEDLDPKIFTRENENFDLQQLRDDLEKELAEKKLELANRLKKEKEEQALEKALEEKRKELANKNVTVDIKGELVYIKSLDINKFMNDFSKSKTKCKDIKTIETESRNLQKKKKTLVVEKNPEALVDTLENDRPQKKKLKLKNQRKKSFVNEDKTQNSKMLGLLFFDRNKEPLISGGSNFDLMNPSCGVNLTEEQKTKSGGKDFFHQYNKYSIQVFEETLSKTISANLYQNQMNNYLNNASSPNVMSLKKKKTLKDTMLYSNKEKEEEKKIINKTENSANKILKESDGQLLVKTNNLRMALSNLDLITEGDEKHLLAKKGKRRRNIIKRKQFIMDFNKQQLKNYEEINSFAKTLLGSENWGENIGKKTNSKQNFRKPKKPVFDELKKELPFNILNHIPRKRLPPINALNRFKENSLGKTLSVGFFNINKKNKLKALSMEENKNVLSENEENKNNENKRTNYNFSSNDNFYKNTIS